MLAIVLPEKKGLKTYPPLKIMEISEKSIIQEIFVKQILAGKIFIYPTDTIYGLGCNALNENAVEKIKLIKERDKEKPLSIIAPSLEWIKENLIIDDLNIKKYLPGAYTLILKKKNQDFLSWVSKTETLGVRIPKHPLTEKIQASGVPFITTSVNLSEQPFALRISEIKKEIKKKVDFIIKAEDESSLSEKPSALIINGKIIERK
jgi:L-threonylcarbamoyladenylate synthase